MSSNRTVWVYGLVDPRDNQVRYVGQSCNPIRRYVQLTRPQANVSWYLKQWNARLRKDGLKPSMMILQETTQELAGEVEQWWIRYYHTADNPLLNQHFFTAPDYRNNANWWNKEKETNGIHKH